MLKEKANPCVELSQKVLNEMYLDGYSSKSVDHHVRPIYNRLARYCEEHFGGMYSVDAGEAFIRMIQRKKLSKGQTNLIQNSIGRLNHALDGDFHWRPAKLKPYAASCYDAVVAGYEAYLIQTGKTINNTRRHIHLIADFLSHMESEGVISLPMIRAGHIHERFAAVNDKAGFRKAVKMFFRYACRYGLVENDNSCWIPAVPRRRPVPSVYTKDEIERILGSIDRTASLGKRNYCIILMAAKLGIRSCDIAGLKLEDVRHGESLIRIRQQKTGIPVEYPILDEIAEALKDYLDNARPASDLPYIFLAQPRPAPSALSTQGIYAVVSGAIARAGIDMSSRRHGAHALRSSLASHLLADGKTYTEIRHVLGHGSPDAARHYIRVEAERLRGCALGVPVFSDELIAYFQERRWISR